MASLSCLLLSTFIVVLGVANICTEATREFEVGDEFGWREPDPENSTMYIQWAERNRFQIGDTLHFDYKNDSVFMVDHKWDYYSCNTSNYVAAFNNGNSSFNLNSSGLFYFISGNVGHCKNGQRLLVDVMSIDHIPHYHSPPSNISLPPDESVSPTAPAPAPAPLSTSAASIPALALSITIPLSLTFIYIAMV